MSEMLWFLILGSIFLLLFAIGEYLFRRRKWDAEHTRKLVHVGSGLLALTFPLVFENHWWVLGLCGSFYLILISSKKFGFLESINGVDRITYGSDLFPVAVYVLFLWYQRNVGSATPEIGLSYKLLYLYYHPLLTLAICDPVAALVGRRFQWIPLTVFGHTKTIAGSLAFCITSITICIGLYYVFGEYYWKEFGILYLLVTGVVTAVAEFISTKGIDNFVIVAVAAILDYLFFI